ncbi:murein DD-endopeptidase MepM/ murein hydrolase activator NlpD [Paenochrobactrum gallinarii]|uniref:Murein DD-endopeptidase MepM/ murein hydrolase activator NlpD n=1 Tax=Paenochrobactrum gallinarii TaxID=643673 RepID=A0A841LVN7_9HYPH|nr:M23 family metallopeptidase [Paenochrobactrum gallinarii]MBB6260940.1 murein DD-endopeptidase MepM/ murein hydrolase activator NlpD [Paenochrobactrum gallinarii]
MTSYQRDQKFTGDEPPLTVGGKRRPPDRRDVSARWLVGTFLTGVTSCTLIGVALFAALDGREQLATPAELLALEDIQPAVQQDVSKGNRIASAIAKQKPQDRRRMEISTMLKVGEREVIRTRPFEYVKMALAVDHPTNRKYPAFNALEVFSEGPSAPQPSNTGQIYGAKVESEISLRVVDFPMDVNNFDTTADLSVDDVEDIVRDTGILLTDGDVQVASLHYVDPLRFGANDSLFSLSPALGVRITQENVSVAARNEGAELAGDGFSEELIPFRTAANISDALNSAGYTDDSAPQMAEALSKLMNSPRLKEGSVLRVGVESRNGEDRIVRASIYSNTTHLVTVTLNDKAQYVPSDEPETTPLLASAFDGEVIAPRLRGAMPSVYDGISRAALAYGMTDTMRAQLIKMLASDVDLQGKLSASDQLEAFFSLPDDSDSADDDSQLLYVSANFGGTTRKFYRYQAPNGTVDYFNENGKSAKQFLLRNPVPNGVFRSPFGMRRHPILGYSRMHTGVDWAAPRGTPIIASGNGVVEKAGWSNGYGNQTLIRHANGYVSSYSHQNAIANGVTPGAKVRQGQVIGYVGSTGLSTGPHLHYELIVNGTKVDPLRIRLPDNKALSGKELEAFVRERERIDKLLNDPSDGTKLAANNSARG